MSGDFTSRLPVETETILLEPLRVANRMYLSAQVLEDMELRTMMEPVLERMMFELRTTLYKVRLDEGRARVIVEHPATWWDSLKKAHAPRWYLRRHPVRVHAYIVRLEVEDLAAFPDNTRIFPKELGAPVYRRVANLTMERVDDEH